MIVCRCSRDTGHPIDLAASGVAFHTDFARSLDADHPTVLMKARRRRAHPALRRARRANRRRRARRRFIVRPGKRLDDATRYLVAIRDLVDTQGTPITAAARLPRAARRIPDADVALACGRPCAAAIAARRAGDGGHASQRLAANGVARDDLILAWDFTTASSEALTGWIVVDPRPGVRARHAVVHRHQRRRRNPAGSGFNAQHLRPRRGHVPGAAVHDRRRAGLAPQPRRTACRRRTATRPCRTSSHIPRVAVERRGTRRGAGARDPLGPRPPRHRFQLGTLSELAQTYNFVIAAVDMQGMSDPDVAGACCPRSLDFSLFHRIPERLHQGFLNHLLLGRLLADPVNGFNSHAGVPVRRRRRAGDRHRPRCSTRAAARAASSAARSWRSPRTSSAASSPCRRSNYSTLLHRSIDFNPFLAILNAPLPRRARRAADLPARSSSCGIAPSRTATCRTSSPGDLSDPPVPHKILIHMATYDCEVSNLGTEIMVRSLGIPQVTPVDAELRRHPRAGRAVRRLGVRRDRPAARLQPLQHAGRQPTPGAACTTDADCPGAGDPADARSAATRASRRWSNLPPLFNNGAHGSTRNPATGQQIDAFLRDGGSSTSAPGRAIRTELINRRRHASPAASATPSRAGPRRAGCCPGRIGRRCGRGRRSGAGGSRPPGRRTTPAGGPPPPRCPSP